MKDELYGLIYQNPDKKCVNKRNPHKNYQEYEFLRQIKHNIKKNLRWRHRQKCFTSLHNQKKDNNQFKSKNNQNSQKIKLHGSPITKELKKKHSSRLVGGGGEEEEQRG